MTLSYMVNIAITFSLGVLASLLAAAIWESVSNRLPTFSKITNTSINGIWVAKFPYKCRPGRDAFNIFRIKENRRGKALLYIEHYNNSVDSVHGVTGIGIFNAPFLSAMYKFTPSFVNQSGTLTLRLKQTKDGVKYFLIKTK